MASGCQRPLSLSSVLAIDLKPCEVISSFVKPKRRRAILSVFSQIGLRNVLFAGNRNVPGLSSALSSFSRVIACVDSGTA